MISEICSFGTIILMYSKNRHPSFTLNQSKNNSLLILDVVQGLSIQEAVFDKILSSYFSFVRGLFWSRIVAKFSFLTLSGFKRIN